MGLFYMLLYDLCQLEYFLYKGLFIKICKNIFTGNEAVWAG